MFLGFDINCDTILIFCVLIKDKVAGGIDAGKEGMARARPAGDRVETQQMQGHAPALALVPSAQTA